MLTHSEFKRAFFSRVAKIMGYLRPYEGNT